MVDVLLTHSYHLYYDPKQVRKMQPYPPLGTLYAAALLREQGFSVALFDTMLENPQRGFPAALRRHRPRLVAIYEDSFNFLTKMCLTRMRDVAFGMIEAARAAGATVVVNGSDASDHAEEYLRQGADYVLTGEAESTLLELTLSQDDLPQKAPSIAGLVFLREDGRGTFRSAPRQLLRDLDALPLPARDLVDLGRYRDAWKASHGMFSLNAVSSRGCPFRCNWCAKPIYGNSYHLRSVESVAAEMEELKKRWGADHVWFADDIFALKTRWAAELAEAVEQRDAVLPFKAQSRVDLMSRENVSALRRAGCREIWMGVESGSQKILDAMDKGTRVEDVLRARAVLKDHGVRACFFLQFGYPGESWQEIEETIRLVRAARPDDIGVSVSYPLPGTKFHERVRAGLGAQTNWVDSDDLAMVFEGTYTREFYRALRDALHAEVASWETAQPGAAPQPGRAADSTGVRSQWETVHRLEKTCRSSAPSLPAVFA